MSHISKCRIGLKVSASTFDLLKKCAEEIGAKVLQTMTVQGYTTTTIKSGFVVSYKGAEIGVTEENGVLTLIGDKYKHNEAWAEFEKKLPQKYKEKAAVIALKKMGFRPQVKQKEKELVVVGC